MLRLSTVLVRLEKVARTDERGTGGGAGQRGVVSGSSNALILNHKRSLTVELVRRLFDELHIPMEALIPRSVVTR